MKSTLAAKSVGRPSTPDTELTGRQRRVLTFIVGFVAKHGFPPTRPELSRGLRMASPYGCESAIVALVKKGYLVKSPRLARGLRVLREPD